MKIKRLSRRSSLENYYNFFFFLGGGGGGEGRGEWGDGGQWNMKLTAPGIFLFNCFF